MDYSCVTFSLRYIHVHVCIYVSIDYALFVIMCVQYIAMSKRYIPEMVNYLTSCCGCFCNKDGMHYLHQSPYITPAVLYYMYIIRVHVGVICPPFSSRSCPVLEVESELSKGTNMDNLPS